MLFGQCQAITKKGIQCKHNNCWEIPNHYSKNGDIITGRSVLLCMKHYLIYEKKKILELIHNGYLQPYNKYNYGTTVIDEIIDWSKPRKIYKINSFWLNT